MDEHRLELTEEEAVVIAMSVMESMESGKSPEFLMYKINVLSKVLGSAPESVKELPSFKKVIAILDIIKDLTRLIENFS